MGCQLGHYVHPDLILLGRAAHQAEAELVDRVGRPVYRLGLGDHAAGL
jgi:hypothetical protein